MQRLANPGRFLRLADAVMPWAAIAATALILLGLYLGLCVAPADYQQGDTVRIMYVHVPAAWMALSGYAFIAVVSAVALVWRHPLAHLVAKAASPLGAAFTFLALVTGSLWGKPTWGTWWVWDGRLTSMLVLLFLYFGYVALAQAVSGSGEGGGQGNSRIPAVFGLVGAVNIPIIHYSVLWWNSLHQPPSISVGKSAMAPDFLVPLLVAMVGFSLIFGGVVLARMRAILADIQAEARLRRKAAAGAFS